MAEGHPSLSSSESSPSPTMVQLFRAFPSSLVCTTLRRRNTCWWLRLKDTYIGFGMGDVVPTGGRSYLRAYVLPTSDLDSRGTIPATRHSRINIFKSYRCVDQHMLTLVFGGYQGRAYLQVTESTATRMQGDSEDYELKQMRDMAAAKKRWEALVCQKNLFWVQGGVEAAEEEDLAREGPLPFKFAGIGGLLEFLGPQLDRSAKSCSCQRKLDRSL